MGESTATIFAHRFRALVPRLDFSQARKGRHKRTAPANRLIFLMTVVRTVALEDGRKGDFNWNKVTPEQMIRIDAFLAEIERNGQPAFDWAIQRFETLRFHASDGTYW